MRWLALLLVLFAAAPAHAAIAHVQTVSCEAQGAASCGTPPTTTTTGNLFIASMGYCCATFTSITDSKGNSYSTSIAELAMLAGTGKIRQAYVVSGTGGASHTFTITGASGSFYASLSVTEVSGAAAAPLDKTATGQSSSVMSHTTSATATTAQANELLVGFGSTSSIDITLTTDTGAGWTERTNVTTDVDSQGIIVGTRIVSATGAYSYTFTSDSPTSPAQGISTWKEAAAAAGVRQRCVGCGADGKVIE